MKQANTEFVGEISGCSVMLSGYWPMATMAGAEGIFFILAKIKTSNFKDVSPFGEPVPLGAFFE